MTDLALASADAPAPAEAALTTAAALAARIPIPTRLPVRYDGEPLRHLSATSYSLWISCPEAWRRKNLLGERQPKSATMVIGSRVDEALSDYYRYQLEHREPLPVDEVLQRYRRGWKDKLEADHERQPIVWDEFDEGTALERGARALEVTFEQLVPQLGIPVAGQRRLEFTLTPALEWSILGYLDLETEWPDLLGEGVVSEVVDYKVKGGNAINQATADRDPQASLYLAGCWLEGQPVFRTPQRHTLTDPGRGFVRRGASFLGGVPVRSIAYRPARCATSILPPSTSWGFARSWCGAMSRRTGRSTTARMSR